MPRTWAHKFLFTVGFVFLGILLCGWLTGLKSVMHSALLSVTVFAFLPFLIIATVIIVPIVLLTLAIVISLVMSVLSEGGGGDLGVDAGIGGGGADSSTDATANSPADASDGHVEFFHQYYDWMARQRSPYFWGVPFGVLLGGATLWGLLSWLVVPKEMKTSETLLRAQGEIAAYYKANKVFPKPSAQGGLPQQLTPTTGTDLVDAFGQPLIYQVHQDGKHTSYRLKSLGFDGKPGKDDLCIAGSNGPKLLEALQIAVETWNQLRPDKAIPVKDRLRMVRDLKCDEN